MEENMNIWGLLRRSLIESILIAMIIAIFIFIYLTEYARFGRCVCDPKLVAMKGKEIYIIDNPTLSLHQQYRCICAARQNKSYLLYVAIFCIIFTFSGVFSAFRNCAYPNLTSSLVNMLFQSFNLGLITLRMYNRNNNKKDIMKKDEKQTKKISACSAIKCPMISSIVTNLPILVIIYYQLNLGNKPIIELIQGDNFIDGGIAIGILLLISYLMSMIYGNKYEKKTDNTCCINTETECDNKNTSNCSSDSNFLYILLYGYFIAGMIGYCIKHDLKVSDIFNI